MIRTPSTRSLLLAAACAVAIGGTATAQVQIRVQRAGGAIAAPGGGDAAADTQDGTRDKGPAVELYESPNLDRFVRRARQFLTEERFADAIQVLQAVVEGRTLEAADSGPAEPSNANEAAGGEVEGAPKTEPVEPPDRSGEKGQGEKGQGEKGQGEKGQVKIVEGLEDGTSPSAANSAEVDPRQAVFSVDGRIYRPAGRLCQEYLAGMPAAGIELYQAMFETAADTALAQALESGSTRDLEQLVVRWFPTLAAGQAQQRLADRYMHEGQYRAAVQTLRDLVELYPRANLSRLGISVLWCRFKIATCLRLAGELSAAHEAAMVLAKDFPDESLRLMGELQPVRDLPEHPMFHTAAARIDGSAMTAAGRVAWLDASTESLVPLWRHRFAGTNPYELVQPKREGETIFFGSSTATNTAPFATKYGVGTQVAFRGDGAAPSRIVFLENFRLRIADAFSGVLQVEGDGEETPPKPMPDRPRPRVPVYDLALATPVEDEDRIYAVLGYNRVTQNRDALERNELVAYRKPACERVWTTQDWGDGDDGLQGVTFLAAPTVFGERLLLPVLRRGAYELQCLDRRSGKPLWHTRIHSGGSTFFRAPGAQVRVLGNVAYVLTNAGAVAAIDAFAGDLRWTRKYEREDPLRRRPARRRAERPDSPFGYGYAFQETELPGFLPSSLLVEGGTLVFAGCDSDMLLCVDSASGEIVWMLDGTSRYAPYGQISHLIGTDATCLFAEAKGDLRNQVVCIEKATGIVRWSQEVPRISERLTNWPGRGCLVGDFVVLPGDRELLVLDTGGQGPWRHLPLPALGIGDEPFGGPNNVYSSGPYVAVCYATGLEVYSTSSALEALAGAAVDPVDRAALLVQSGKKAEALDELLRTLAADDATPEHRERRVLLALDYARELGVAAADQPTAALDRVQPFATGKSLQLAFRLARMDVFRARSDAAALEQEQQILYRLMEGRQ